MLAFSKPFCRSHISIARAPESGLSFRLVLAASRV